jgi:hypothetical protein
MAGATGPLTPDLKIGQGHASERMKEWAAKPMSGSQSILDIVALNLWQE